MTPILQEAARHTLRIRCPVITLERGGGPILKVGGQGEIFFNPSGRIAFKFDVPSEEYAPFVKSRLEHSRPPSSPPRDEDYFELAATTESGQTWRGKLLDPIVNNITPQGILKGPGIAGGTLDHLTLEESVDPNGPSSVEITIAKKLFVPLVDRFDGVLTPDRFFLKLDDERIDVLAQEAHTEIVCAVIKGGVAAHRHWRMIEAFEFATGQSIYPSSVRLQEEGKAATILHSAIAGTESESQVPPPIAIAPRVHHYSITQLVQKFYRYVLPCKSDDQPMIARGLWALRQAANAQPDPKALAYSIALETLISACFFNIKPPIRSSVTLIANLKYKLLRVSTDPLICWSGSASLSTTVSRHAFWIGLPS